MRAVIILVIILVFIPPVYAYDVQFHFITENGNIFLLSGPDEPRPPNIIGETAFLSVDNPPAGMFIVTSNNGTIQRVTPLQTGIDVSDYSGSDRVRVITYTDWNGGSVREFRDQPFGTLSNGINGMYHSNSMGLIADYSNYTMMSVIDSSRFDLGSGSDNTLGTLTQGSNGEYTINMATMNRAGLNFGPGSDATYYIYWGCRDCNTNVVVGFGGSSDQARLPNDHHPRGWESTQSCGVSDTDTWSTNSGTIDVDYHIPSEEHSQAGDYTISNRYDDLSILPQHHTSSTYTDETDDNRRFDMDIIAITTSTPRSEYLFSCSGTITVETCDEHGSNCTTQSSSGNSGTTTRYTDGSCTNEMSSQRSSSHMGYIASADCTAGPAPSKPADINNRSSPVDMGGNQTRVTTRTCNYNSSPTLMGTTATISTTCDLHIQTPHLTLNESLTVKPGLNIYRPDSSFINQNLTIIMDDTENGGGQNERIQVFHGPDDILTGPYDFHLRTPESGILYDDHDHYGWIDHTKSYTTEMLEQLGYTIRVSMAGFNDGLGTSGTEPYNPGQRLCHGDCLLGLEGIDGEKPRLMVLRQSPPSHGVVLNGLIYDHKNNDWYSSGFGYGTDGLVTATSLYLTVPFSVDTTLVNVWLFNENFDPTQQLISPNDALSPTADLCHLRQAGQIEIFDAGPTTISAGNSIHIPILPEMRYSAFIGNGECHWYDIASLPSPLSSISSGARMVPLNNGTILGGTLTVKHDGQAHVDIITDLRAVYQSEMYGDVIIGTPADITQWSVPPLKVNVTAIAQVNGLGSSCGDTGMYCSQPITLVNSSAPHIGTYIHGSVMSGSFTHDEPYGIAPTSGAGQDEYGFVNGRCYGLETIIADTGGIIARSIPGIPVNAGDTIALSFNVIVISPRTIPGLIETETTGEICDIKLTEQSLILDVSTMTATLR